MRTREIHLTSRPRGWPNEELFRVVEAELSEPGPGEVLIENSALSVDPYMRPKMDDVPSYTPPYQLNAPLEGRAVGTVIGSGDPTVPLGAQVLHRAGWREHALLPAADVTLLPDLDVPLTHHLGVLGITGFTAWIGLNVIESVTAGDQVFVSAAAGAVGSVAGQIARLRGAGRVVGSTGSTEKASWLCDELRFDAAINYREEPIGVALRRVMPQGCDLGFDNVGGDHLGAALEVMNDFGRLVMCGSISLYNESRPSPMPDNLVHVTRKRLTMRGFITSDHLSLREQFLAEVAPWVSSGDMVTRETVINGLDLMPRAFVAMLSGATTGKTVVRLTAAEQ
ncbi:NADP-dependent oxidoreductase [Nocardioides alcanivorans]|uniref:NADP-dependent oxidoreductase n=1 Tax=Nocardioides alcanivorans TaxID=2897352 RepID=UPI001F206CFF|nr:NADP-dependent oxidoreductase [Nocardioides alcanivorans]